MTPTLRKRHFRIWTVFAVLLPIVFLWAYTIIPQSSPLNEIVQHHTLPTQLNEVLKEADHEKLKINLRKGIIDSTLAYQLEIIVKAPLTRPSTWVYVGEDDHSSIDNQKLVGVLANQGVYRFPVPSGLNISTVTLHDVIKQESWEQINFK